MGDAYTAHGGNNSQRFVWGGGEEDLCVGLVKNKEIIWN